MCIRDSNTVGGDVEAGLAIAELIAGMKKPTVSLAVSYTHLDVYKRQVYGQFRNTSAATLSAQLKQLLFFANVRKYPSTLDAALDGNEVRCV